MSSLNPVEHRAKSLGRSKEHQFVHTIRFWSMVGIVAMHAFILADVNARANGYNPGFLVESVMQLCKFATIAFFLISGFLMGERLPARGAWNYFLRRVQRVGLPWLFWLSLCVALSLAQHSSNQPEYWVNLRHHPGAILRTALAILNYSSFWFVPNLLFALGCILLLRRWIDSVWVGMLFGACTLFYSANIYKGWTSATHQEALFGYIFFLWLGAQTARHFDLVKERLEAIPPALLILAVVVTYAASMWEASILRSATTPTFAEFNSIRFTNILFSIAVSVALMRIPHRTWPKFINVGATTFGIYLIHIEVLSFVPMARSVLHTPSPHSALGIYADWIITFVAAYLLTLGVTLLLSRFKLTAALIGAKPRKTEPTFAPAIVVASAV